MVTQMSECYDCPKCGEVKIHISENVCGQCFEKLERKGEDPWAQKLIGMKGPETSAQAMSIQVGGSHYKNFPIQPVDFCQRNQLNYCESAAIKYLCRHREKNGIEDLKKARHYIDLLMEIEYGNG